MPHLLTLLINILLPHRCLKCGSLLDDKAGICGGCWGQLHFLSKPYCARCGYPFPVGEGEDLLCGKCLKEPAVLSAHRSVFAYDDASVPLILSFKHGDVLRGIPLFAEWMVQRNQDLLEGTELILPVPLHWTRLLKRRYNQASLLAQRISKSSHIPCHMLLLKRIKRTPSQGRLTSKERTENVKRAFGVAPSKKSSIQGKTLLLIDDVYTTGATLQACARVLLKAGAKEVKALTLARVVKPVHS